MKPKPQIKLSLAKESPKKPQIITEMPRHKYTTSLITPKSMLKMPLTSKARPSFSSFLTPSASKSMLTSKHHHTMSQQFPLTSQSPRLIKTQQSDTFEDKIQWKSQSLPVSPETTLSLFKPHLSPYEQAEILKYPEVYCIGIGSNKVKNIQQHNFGYDDEEGNYKIITGDHIAYRYEILQILGSGTFGRVVKILDHKSHQELALKIIKNKPRFHEQAQEEIEILTFLRVHDPDNTYSIIHLQEAFTFRNHIVIPR